MNLTDEIKTLASKIAKQRKLIKTEEATKTAFIMPFINALGYNVFDPQEVMPEFTADIGTKKGEKVDYAIIKDGKPIILFECKWLGVDLDQEHKSQLYRYFSVTQARFAVLTNGILYRFYTDIDEPNKMDSKPFMELNMLEIQESTLDDLKRFTRASFDIDKNLTAATELKYTSGIKRILSEQLNQPSEEFVRFFASQVYSGKLTKAVKQQFNDLVKKALQQFLSDRINERLKSALVVEEPVQNSNKLDIKGKKQKPLKVILKGKDYKVSSWRDVLKTTLETITDNPKLLPKIIEQFPRYIAMENKFRYRRQLSNGAFMNTELTGQDIYDTCRQIIKFVGLSDNEWKIEFR